MALTNFARRMAIIEQQSLTTDTGGGQAISGSRMWTQVAKIPVYVSTSDSSLASSDYDRETITNRVTVSAVDELPVRINGHKLLSEALMANGVDRFRILYRGRTLSPDGVSIPNDRSIGPKIVTITCVETPQPVGGMDYND